MSVLVLTGTTPSLRPLCEFKLSNRKILIFSHNVQILMKTLSIIGVYYILYSLLLHFLLIIINK